VQGFDVAHEFGDGDPSSAPNLAGANLLGGDKAFNGPTADAEALSKLTDGEELRQLERIRIQGEET